MAMLRAETRLVGRTVYQSLKKKSIIFMTFPEKRNSVEFSIFGSGSGASCFWLRTTTGTATLEALQSWIWFSLQSILGPCNGANWGNKKRCSSLSWMSPKPTSLEWLQTNITAAQLSIYSVKKVRISSGVLLLGCFWLEKAFGDAWRVESYDSN